MSLRTKFNPMGGGVANSCPYTEGQVLLESTVVKSHTLELLTSGTYKVVLTGGGGSSATGQYGYVTHTCAGGHGGTFIGNFSLKQGKYTVTLGASATGSTNGGTMLINGYWCTLANGKAGGQSVMSFGSTQILTCTGGGGASCNALNTNSAGGNGTATANATYLKQQIHKGAKLPSPYADYGAKDGGKTYIQITYIGR